VKIECRCGVLIIDQADGVPHKAHLIPDRAWLGLFDTIDAEVVEPLAAGRLSADAAGHTVRRLVIGASRGAWQCGACGRLYVDGPDGRLHPFAPEGDAARARVFGGAGD
jgi:hypothetical protein